MILLNPAVEASKQTFVITGFVFTMMLVIEYINVLSSGGLQKKFVQGRWAQYLLAAILGATPGCLGAFLIVALYSHRVISIGAVVATMIATSGDEAFVMLAVIPKQALILTIILFFLGMIAGFCTDQVLGGKLKNRETKCLEVHNIDNCRCYPRGEIVMQWQQMSIARGSLILGNLILLIAIVTGELGPEILNWKKVTLISVTGIGLFIVSTVPEHFLEKHLWEHVVKKHLPQIFLWTFAALFVVQVVTEQLKLGELITNNQWSVLITAVLVGIIPSSGPHLVFVMFFSKALIPFSILLGSSIVQDGHGMIPLLGYSRKDFFIVKIINVLLGIMVGGVLLVLGF